MKTLVKLGFSTLVLGFSVAISACGPSGTGGDDTPSDDGGGSKVDAPNQVCVGTECMKLECASGTSTKISGRVYTPKGDVPVPSARVYMPKSRNEFPATVSCEVCSSPTDPAWV